MLFINVGTIWLQTMIQLVSNGVKLDDEPSSLRQRWTVLEMSVNGVSGAERAQQESPPRLLKSHLQEHILSKAVLAGKPRVIILYRNPKDILVSLYHWYQKIPDLRYPGTWNDFFEMYRNKMLNFGDVFQFAVGWWKHRDEGKFLFLWYEDIQRDPHSAVKQIARHSHVDLTSEQVDKIVMLSDFNAMRSSKSIKEYFSRIALSPEEALRKGKVGDWQNYFTPEQSRYVDAECTRLLDTVGLKFTFG